jgi:hypothetical protein
MSLGGVIAAGTTGAMLGNIVWYLPRARSASFVEADHRSLRPLDHHGLGRGAACRALVPAQRHLLRLPRAHAADRAQPRVRARRPAQDAVQDVLRRLHHRHAGWTSALAYAGYKLREQFTEVDEWLGPVSNAILVTLVLGYVWRLIRYRAD